VRSAMHERVGFVADWLRCFSESSDNGDSCNGDDHMSEAVDAISRRWDKKSSDG